MRFGHLFTLQMAFWGPETQTFKMGFRTGSFWKLYYHLHVNNKKMWICENGNAMHMCKFLYKVSTAFFDCFADRQEWGSF